MEQGSRSADLSEKAEKDEDLPSQLLVGSEEDDIVQRDFDLKQEGSSPGDIGTVEELLASSLNRGAVNAVREEKRECTGDSEIGESEIVMDNGKKKGGEEVEENRKDVKVKKKAMWECNHGRVLRSSSASKTTVNQIEGVREESSATASKSRDSNGSEVIVGKEDGSHSDTKVSKVKRQRGRPPKVQQINEFEKKNVKVEPNEINHSATEMRKGVKRKRGRPPKLPMSNQIEMKAVEVGTEEGEHFCDEVKEVKRRRGRPPKLQRVDGSGEKRIEVESKRTDHTNGKMRKGLKRKRGRPPKVQTSNGIRQAMFNKGRKLGKFKKGKNGLIMRDRLKRKFPSDTSCSKNELNGEELDMKKTEVVKKVKFCDTENDTSKFSLTLSSKVLEVGEMVVQRAEEMNLDEEAEKKRSAAKRVVRDRIVKMLLDAGWKIQYRPRNGRAYSDAVYVNPEGKTHWSVTLAYRVLKSQYESADDNSKISNSSFTFVPIPEEEISILTRVVQNKREGKKKSKLKGKNGNGTDQERPGKKEKQKRKFGQKGKNADQNEIQSGTLQQGTALSGRKHKPLQSQNKKRCGLLVRNSIEGAESNNDGYVLYDGKRTLLAWMIDLGTVPLDGKVQYFNQRRTRVIREGKITKDGIQCHCCCEIFTVSKFETHAGSKINQAFQNMCLEKGTSLLQCLLNSWNKQEETTSRGFHFVDVDGEDPNDDTCGICGDGGDLICCDSCPSTFHQSCLNIDKFPSGDWHCVYCTCKFCGENTYGSGMNEVSITSELLTCCLCEDKYHELCIQQKDAVNSNHSGASFCGKRCQELFERLQMLNGVKHELQDGFSWTLIHRFDISSDVCLSEGYQKLESNAKLAVALSIMDECFCPLVDHRSGVNLIRNIVYNFRSNLNRLNYGGFFTAILERGDEMVSAASIRIHGDELAEMPFIGTRYLYRRQGMCRRLLSAIESALCSLNVQKLVIPAVSELRDTWTSVFGFKPLETSNRQKMRNMNMVVFPGVDMLQKPLLRHQSAVENLIPDEGSKSMELKDHLLIDERCSVAPDLNVSGEGVAPYAGITYEEPAAIISASQLSDGFLNYTSDLTYETRNFPESAAASGLCVPTSNEGIMDSRFSKTYMNINGNLDSHSEEFVQCSDDVIPTKTGTMAAIPGANISREDVVTYRCDGNHRESQQILEVECVSDFDKSVIKSQEEKIDNTVSNIISNQNCSPAQQEAHDVKNSNDGIIQQGADNVAHGCDGISSDVIADQNSPSALQGRDDANTYDKSIVDSCHGDGVDASGLIATATLDTSRHQSFGCHDVAAEGANCQPFLNNGIFMSTAGTSVSFGTYRVSSCESKAVASELPSDFSRENQVRNTPQICTTSSRSLSDTLDDPSTSKQHDPESLCTSHSGSGVALHCASTGGKSCSPEVIMLSNQAS